MRIVFVGASRFGLRCLDSVARIPGIKVCGVLTAPRRFSISYRPAGVENVLHADFGEWARDRGAPLFEIRNGMRDPKVASWLARLSPEYLVVVGWYHMIPKDIYSAYPALGLHASLLPDYSGGAPLVWAIINGEQRTGITLFKMNDGVDAGSVYAQFSTPIFPQDTIATLYARIEDLGVDLLEKTLPEIAVGRIVPIPQDESLRRVFPQRSPEDGVIDWTLPASKVYDFIRAQTRPYPGAYTICGELRLSVWAGQPAVGNSAQVAESAANSRPGAIRLDADAVLVVCGKGTYLRLLEIEMSGRRYSEAALPIFFREHGVNVLGSAN